MITNLFCSYSGVGITPSSGKMNTDLRRIVLINRRNYSLWSSRLI